MSPVMMTSTCAANAIGVLELVDRFLELVVEDGAIDDDGDGVKLLCALRGVERGEAGRGLALGFGVRALPAPCLRFDSCVSHV